MSLKVNRLFFLSVFAGILLWLVVFLVLPVSTVESIKPETISFIFANYGCLIIGFLVIKRRSATADYRLIKIDTQKTLYAILAIIGGSFLLRYVDLFFIRELSFYNSIPENRALSSQNYEHSNLIFAVASILKSLYFFPFVMLLSSIQIRKRLPFVLSCVLLAMPLIEAILLGTRRQFFEVFLILFLSYIVFQKIKITTARVFIFLGSLMLMLAISATLLFKRETEKKLEGTFYDQILGARYNELLIPKPYVANMIMDENNSDLKKQTIIILLQTGQYITHGLFEFNHVVSIKDELPISNGAYTFYPITKFLNAINIVQEIPIQNDSPRKIVFLTAFGSFYLDFRWLTLLLMFAIGASQKLIFNRASSSILWRPLMIYFIIINVFLLVFNYFRGAGIYPIVGFALIILMAQLPIFKLNEKSIST